MSLISASALDWALVDGPCGPDGPAGISEEQWDAAKDSAIAWLWALSGRQFGTWAVVFRPEWTVPVAQACRVGPRWHVLDVTPPVRRGVRAPLPGPAQVVTEVLVDGAVLDAAKYELQRDQLIRIDGDTWPAYQDTGVAATEAGTWQISYTRGKPVPAGGQVAAGVLACEIGCAVLGLECRLPSNVQTVVRNGVTISLDAKQLQLGFTGLATIDQWVRMVNPKLRVRNPTVWSPDIDPDLLPPIPAATTI